MATTRWDEHGNPISDASSGGQRWDEHGQPITAPTIEAAPKAAAPVQGPSMYQKLTDPDNPGGRAYAEAHPGVGGQAVRALSAIGGGVLSAPEAIYGAFRHPINTLDTALDAASSWANPTGKPIQVDEGDGQTTTIAPRPTWGQVKEVAPEALGGATGQVALGELLSHPTVKPHLDKLNKTFEQQIPINEGRIRLANEARQAAIQLREAVTGPNGEVGKHAQAVIEADKLDLQRTQSEGKVDGASAIKAVSDKLDQLKMGGEVAPGFKAQMTMDEAKAILTRLGREGAKLDRAGKAPEASVVWTGYDALRQATQDRAAQIGPDYAKSWKHYSDEFYKFTKLQGKPFGDILEREGEVGSLKQLTDPDNASHFFNPKADSGSVVDWMRKYKVDPEPLTRAAKQGKILDELTQKNSATVMGKIKLLARHPVIGLPVLAATHAGASAAGLGGGLGGLVVSLIVAGKVAGLLDKSQIKSLLKDIGSRGGPELGQVSPPGEGPMPLPQPPSGGAGVTPVPAGGAVGTGPLEETPKPSAQEAADIQAESGLPLGDEGIQQRITGRSDLADKLSKARRSRGTGVYRGKR